ncbi:NADH-quinone oxidoreductase subunit C [Streptacidiphilus sp. PAMC 29251]
MTPAERTAAAIGPWAAAEEAFALLTVDVPAEHWIEALTAARDTLGLTFFDWLSAVDELADGFSVAVHLAAVGTPAVGSTPAVRTAAVSAAAGTTAAGVPATGTGTGTGTSTSTPSPPVGATPPPPGEGVGRIRRVLLRTRIPRGAASLPTATGLFAGAGWHERETHEMFGIDFPGHPHLAPLLLPDGFEGHPLRKEFVLAARVAKAWPGAKEPGESDHGSAEGAPAARRRMLPPGVPDPNEWGPLAGTLPPVAERPARGAARGPRAAAATAAPDERPAVRADRPRRNRSVDQGSASQAPPTDSPATDTPATAAATPDAPWQIPLPPNATPPEATPPSETAPPEATPPPQATPPPEATPPSPTGDDA